MNPFASEKQVLQLQQSIASLKCDCDCQHFDLQHTKWECKNSVKLLQNKVSVVSERCNKLIESGKDLHKTLLEYERFIVESKLSWKKVSSLVSEKLLAIENSVHKRIMSQLTLMKAHYDQEIKIF